MEPADDSGTVDAIAYHSQTKHTPASVRGQTHGLDWPNKPIPFKLYEQLETLSLEETPTLPEVPTLEAIAGDPLDERVAEHPTFADLASLCHGAVGITKWIEIGGEERGFRAAACTGALYHIDLYLVTGPLDELEAGVYHYDPKHERLDVLRTGDYREELVEATAGQHDIANAPATLIATSTWWRNAWKYRERTFRHAFWDGGTAIANLLSVAAGHGLRTTVVTGFVDTRVAHLLGVSLSEEAPIALIPVGKDGPAPESVDSEPIQPETRPLSPEVTDYPLIREAHAGGCLDSEEAVRTWRETSWSVAEEATSSAERVALSPVGPERASKRPLDRTIKRRGSARSYRRDRVSDRLLGTILDRAVRPVALDVERAEGPLRFSRPYLIVSGVSDVPSGTYRYEPAEDALLRLRTGQFRQEAGHLALDQQLGADAAVCIYFMADLARVIEAFGNRGYRIAQLEAAIIAGRMYLAAYAHRDVGATGLTFYDDDVTEFFAPDAAGRTPMFLLTLGRPDT